MNRSSKTAIALIPVLLGALALMPACDKGKDADKSGDAKGKIDEKGKKTVDKGDAHAGMDHGAHGGEAKAAESVEVAADGRVEINVDASGYHPETISAPPKSKITLAFKRTTESGCGQELVIKSLDIKKELPVDEVVEIEVEVPESGELGFACGMDMYKGKVVPKA